MIRQILSPTEISMYFQEPFHVYTPATNVEAHVIVDLLSANGIPAMAVEDQSGASLWAFGTIGQFHRPKIWVDKPTAERAYALILDYEERKRERRHPDDSGGDVAVVCEECGGNDVIRRFP